VKGGIQSGYGFHRVCTVVNLTKRQTGRSLRSISRYQHAPVNLAPRSERIRARLAVRSRREIATSLDWTVRLYETSTAETLQLQTQSTQS